MFERSRFFIVDMDGTFYLGDSMIPHADEALRYLVRMGKDYFFFSNNSSHSVETCRARLERIGFSVPGEKIILSSHVAGEYLRRIYPGACIYVLGNRNLKECIRSMGIPVASKKENADVLLLGYDTDLTYARLCAACDLIRAGKPYLATHPDVNCPVPGGFVPDIGAMIEMIAASTGKRPRVLGKPMRASVDYLVKRLQCRRDELVFVGDRLETDIRIGADHGIPTVLVLTGASTAEMAKLCAYSPSLIINSIADLPKYF